MTSWISYMIDLTIISKIASSKESIINTGYNYDLFLIFLPLILSHWKSIARTPFLKGEEMKISDITRKGIFQKFLEKGGWKKADRGFNLKKGFDKFL